jgi:hypothetical protein
MFPSSTYMIWLNLFSTWREWNRVQCLQRFSSIVEKGPVNPYGPVSAQIHKLHELATHSMRSSLVNILVYCASKGTENNISLSCLWCCLYFSSERFWIVIYAYALAGFYTEPECTRSTEIVLNAIILFHMIINYSSVQCTSCISFLGLLYISLFLLSPIPDIGSPPRQIFLFGLAK